MMTKMTSRRLFLSERGLVLEYGDRIDPVISGRVRLMASVIRARQVDGILNLVPTYRSLLVEYDPLAVSLEKLNAVIDDIEQDLEEAHPPEGRYFELPTYYGKPYDFDTERIAEHNDLTPEDVVRIFSETTLLIYFIGFIAALPYIGGLPECLHTPRLPRWPIPRWSFLPVSIISVVAFRKSMIPTVFHLRRLIPGIGCGLRRYLLRRRSPMKENSPNRWDNG
jgi:KipI family sensor histidine kinase inhibitor